MTKTTGPNIAGIKEMQAYRNAYSSAAVVAMIGIVIGNFVGGTTAGAMLGDPSWFGKPFLALAGGIKMYSMAPILISIVKYRAVAGVTQAAEVSAAAFFMISGGFGGLGLRQAHRIRKRIFESDMHGSAHFAARHEIEASGLLPVKTSDPDHVCYVGGWIDPKTKKQVYLQHSGPEHIIVHAPTRSGKGVGLVIPSLLAWKGSALIHDIKGENYAITAGWRRSIGQRVLRFAPSEPENSCRFNPLDEIRIRTDHEIKDVQNIATMIVDPDGRGLNDHWAKTGYALLVGTILHVLYSPSIKSKTLAAVASLLSNPDYEDVDDLFDEIKSFEHDPDGSMNWRDHNGQPTKTHPVVAQSAQEMLNKAPNEKSGVISTAMSFLSLYRDPLVAETISRSDFRITDLMHDENPVSLYVVVPPSDKDRLKPLVRLILNQVVRRLSERMDFEGGRSVARYKHRLLLMIDEFPSLGKLDVFEEALAFIAGYGMKAYLICQDTAQLHKAYTQNESITSNAHIRVFYAPNRIETAKYLSEMLGKRTVTTESNNVNYAGSNLLPYQTGLSAGIQHQARDLMTADEVMRLAGPEKDAAGNILRPGEMIVLAAGFPPISGTQILYFRDPSFQRRASIEAPPGRVLAQEASVTAPKEPAAEAASEAPAATIVAQPAETQGQAGEEVAGQPEPEANGADAVTADPNEPKPADVSAAPAKTDDAVPVDAPAQAPEAELTAADIEDEDLDDAEPIDAPASPEQPAAPTADDLDDAEPADLPEVNRGDTDADEPEELDGAEPAPADAEPEKAESADTEADDPHEPAEDPAVAVLRSGMRLGRQYVEQHGNDALAALTAAMKGDAQDQTSKVTSAFDRMIGF